MVNVLLDKGARVNKRENYHGGCIPLHYAAANGHIEVINALLVKGANVYEERWETKDSFVLCH
ncbi:MAG: ankyrin repeat domain-containing protein [Wolbachia sp.]